MEDDNKNEINEIPDSMKNYFINIQDALGNKFENIKSKLDLVEEELLNYIINELCEIGNLNKAISEMQNKLKEKSEDKNKLIETTKLLKLKLNDLLKKIDKIEKFGSIISEMKINELLKIENDEFNLIKVKL